MRWSACFRSWKRWHFRSRKMLLFRITIITKSWLYHSIHLRRHARWIHSIIKLLRHHVLHFWWNHSLHFWWYHTLYLWRYHTLRTCARLSELCSNYWWELFHVTGFPLGWCCCWCLSCCRSVICNLLREFHVPLFLHLSSQRLVIKLFFRIYIKSIF